MPEIYEKRRLRGTGQAIAAPMARVPTLFDRYNRCFPTQRAIEPAEPGERI
jgi:hypothetical protein